MTARSPNHANQTGFEAGMVAADAIIPNGALRHRNAARLRH
jgi:hypothetical protein